MTIQEEFRVKAPPERVWAFLIQPEGVVVCLPGARITEVLDETHFLCEMRVKVGPASLSYKGKAYDIGDGTTSELALKLFDELMGIQYGQRPDPFGWIREVVPGSNSR